MPLAVITSIIGAVAIIAGSLVGAFCSWIINKNMHQKKLKSEHEIIEENRRYEERYRLKEICNNANVIRLDIATALFQSIRTIQDINEDKKYVYVLPINKNYSQAIASLNDKYNLQELSYIYQVYGIIEKVNRCIYNWNIGDKNDKELDENFNSILFKLYGHNVKKVLQMDINNISYEELYDNDYIDAEYKIILKKLDYLCEVDNLIQDDVKK